MLPFNGPFLYKCNDCGKIFEKTHKINIVDNRTPLLYH